MYPTEEQIRARQEEDHQILIASTALDICKGNWDYASFLRAVKTENFKTEVDNMIRHYLSLPKYKHLPIPPGFKM